MDESLKRALRTLAQVSLVESIIALLAAFGVPLTPPEHAAVIAVATPLVAAVQCVLEDKGVVKKLGR